MIHLNRPAQARLLRGGRAQSILSPSHPLSPLPAGPLSRLQV
jgi:hypothetical protein